jgi:hypothetical protein
MSRINIYYVYRVMITERFNISFNYEGVAATWQYMFNDQICYVLENLSHLKII